MSEAAETALLNGGIADITTAGRKSGRACRIEIVFHNIDGTLHITGKPGTRDWLANPFADPNTTLHLKHDIVADLPATATVTIDRDDRRRVLYRILTRGFRIAPEEANRSLSRWTVQAPLVRVDLA